MSEEKGFLEKILLAGIGALALTYDKSKEMLDQLAQRGEITAKQAGVLNEELKRSIKGASAGAGKSTAGTSSETDGLEKLINNIDKLSAEERNALKAKLNELDNSK